MRFFLLAVLLILMGCKFSSKKDADSFEYKSNEPPTEKSTSEQDTNSEPVEIADVSSVPIDLKNKGIGPIKRVRFRKNVEKDLADEGQQLFQRYCVACHFTDRKMIGPAMTGIFERRSPEWVMNLLLNPIQMLGEDPIGIALLEEYNGVMMLDQNLSEDQARAITEYLRTL